MTGHRIQLEPSTHHVRVEHGGTVIADSSQPLLLHETGLPVRYYLPREDVRVELMGPTETRTRCPFKGEASHWSARVDGEVLPDVAWSYEEPIAGVAPIAGLVAFYPDRVDVTVEDAAGN